MGKECPMITDIQLERQGRDERNLIKVIRTQSKIFVYPIRLECCHTD